MRELTSGALLDGVRGVHWPSRRLTSGALHGVHRSRRAGVSPEFMDYRPYQQGDDSSRIDWKLFGRTERAAIRLSHDDSTVRTMVLVDASASMAFPTAAERPGKWDVAAALALGLCAVALGDGDPAGVAVAGAAGLRVLPPRTRGGTTTDILHLLMRTTPAGNAPLAPAIAALPPAPRLAIVSDFLGDVDDVIERCRELVAAGREVYAVHIVSREELDPGPMGAVVDPEDPAMRRPLSEQDIETYRENFARWRSSVAARWRDAGAVYRMVTTDESPAHAVRRVVAPAGAATGTP